MPELSIGVSAGYGYRGRGVGTALSGARIQQSRDEGFDALSLGVEKDNPAVRFHERAGFTRVCFPGNAWTMRMNLWQEREVTQHRIVPR